jgi:phage shock protein A
MESISSLSDWNTTFARLEKVLLSTNRSIHQRLSALQAGTAPQAFVKQRVQTVKNLEEISSTCDRLEQAIVEFTKERKILPRDEQQLAQKLAAFRKQVDLAFSKVKLSSKELGGERFLNVFFRFISSL